MWNSLRKIEAELLHKIIALSIGIGVGLAILWVFLPEKREKPMQARFSAEAPTQENVMRADDSLNHVFKPNLKTKCPWYYEKLRGEDCTLSTNSLGWKSLREPRVPKADNHFRIFVLGDSHVEGQNDDRDTMPYQLETLLTEFFESSSREVEVFNLGVSSYSTIIYLVLLQKVVLDMEPDLVILNLDHTDLIDDWIYQSVARFDDSEHPVAVGALGKATPRSELHPFEPDAWIYDKPSPEIEEQEPKTMGYLKEIVRRCRAQRVPIVTSMTAAMFHIFPDAPGQGARMLKRNGDSKISLSMRSYEEVRKVTEENGALYFDAYRNLKERFEENHAARFINEGHNNHYTYLGNKDWAEALAAFLITHEKQLLQSE